MTNFVIAVTLDVLHQILSIKRGVSPDSRWVHCVLPVLKIHIFKGGQFMKAKEERFREIFYFLAAFMLGDSINKNVRWNSRVWSFEEWLTMSG